MNTKRHNVFARQKNIILLSTAFFMLLISQNNFDCTYPYLFENEENYTPGVKGNKLRALSQGLFNVVGIGAVRLLGYKASFVFGNLLVLPGIFIGCWLNHLAGNGGNSGKIGGIPAKSLVFQLYGYSVIQGIGQSIGCIAQGCYVDGIVNKKFIPEAYSIFSTFYNLSYPMGTLVIKLSKQGKEQNADFALITFALAAVVGTLLFLMLKPLCIANAKGKLFPFTSRTLTGSLVGFGDILMATVFVGVIFRFISSSFETPLERLQDSEAQATFFLCYGFAATFASVLGSLFLTEGTIGAFSAVSICLHAVSIVLYRICSVNDHLSKETLINLSYTYSVCYALASSTFVTIVFTLLSLRYSDDISFAMWMFQVLSCVVTACSTEEFKNWPLVFGCFGICGYISIFWSLFKVKRLSKSRIVS
jgi:hypothetical protein